MGIRESDLAPGASPGQQSKSGVRRVNNLPLYLVGGAMGVFLIIMVSVAANRGQQQNKATATPAPEQAASATMYAKAIAGDQKDGIIQPSSPATAEATSTGPVSLAIARPANPDLPPLPPTSAEPPAPPTASGAPDETLRIRTLKLQQLDEAVHARSGVQMVAGRDGGRPLAAPVASTASIGSDDISARLASVRQQIDAADTDDPSAAYQAKLQLLHSIPGHGMPLAPIAGRNDVTQFAGGQGDRWRLDSQPQAPRTAYELRAGFVIPALLISGINSELPGQIMAQVSQDVYDTARSKWKLIPQGARLVGAYSSEVAYGQARVLVAWQRIIFPDGKAMDIGAMPGADPAGYAGFTDQTNNHYWRTFSSAFLMSAVTAGIATSQPQSTGYGRPGFSGAMSEAVGQQLGQVTAQLITKNLNIAPDLEIRPGYRFDVIVTKDLSFTKPYQPFDY